MNILWASFIALTIFNAGNMNYQQDAGYYELNPIYGRHPSSERVYLTKAIEVAGIYGLTKMYPEHKKDILIGANSIVLGMIMYDKHHAGIAMKVIF